MTRPPITAAEVESALEYAHAVGAPFWLIALLERELAQLEGEDVRRALHPVANGKGTV